MAPIAHAAQLASAALALALLGCGDGRAHVDPLASVVAVTASGCRPYATNAVGTVVGDGLVVTVAHAVAGEREIMVRAADDRELPAVLAAIDPAMDVAVLRVDGLDADGLEIGSYDDGDVVSLLGVHDGMADHRPVAVRRAVTIRTTDIYREGEHLRPGLDVEASVRSGDSGGGLVGADGDLLGMVWAASREADDRAWAVTSGALAPLVAAAESGQPADTAACSR